MIANKGIPLRKNWIYRRGDLYLVNLNPVKGSEQGGTRPVVVLQNDVGNYFSDTMIVAPLTSVLKKLNQPTHCYLRWNRALDAPSVVQAEQITRIDKIRIISYLGRLTKEQMERVDIAVENSLGLPIPESVEAP